MKKMLAIDLFALRPGFNLNGKETYKTCCGVVASYLIFALSITALFYFGTDMYYYRNPRVLMSENSFDENMQPELNLQDERFQIAFGILKDGKIMEFDPSYFSIKAVMRTWERNTYENFERSVQEVGLRECTEKDFKMKNKKVYSYLRDTNLSCLKCLDFGESKNTRIRGTFGRANYTSLVLNIDECKNSSDLGVVCKSTQEISNMLQNLYFGGLFVNKYVDLKDFNAPVDEGVEYFYLMPSKKYNKELMIKFKKVKIRTDEGWVQTKVLQQEHIVLSSVNEKIRSEGQSDVSIAVLSFYMDISEISYLRQYVKFQEVLASIGGIIKAIMMIVALLIEYPVKLKYERFLVNFLCKNTFEKPFNEDESISFSDIFRKKFFWRKKERNRYAFATKVLREKMDMIKVLRKLVEVDVIKNILFESRAQRNLYHYCCSKVFWDYFKERPESQEQQISKTLQKFPTIRGIKNCYETILKESNSNLLSKKLTSLYQKISFENKVRLDDDCKIVENEEPIEEEQVFPMAFHLDFTNNIRFQEPAN